MKPSASTCCLFLALGLSANAARGQDKGLAAKYPKDVGIGRDKAVLFHDDFEDGKIGAAWDEVNRRKGRGATDDTEPVEAETDKALVRAKLDEMTWEAMPPPAGNEQEDPVSELLCRSLRQSRNGCDLPFRIDTQLVELDPAAGQDQGRMDIVFSPMYPRENIYFALECKRLNVRSTNGVRPYFAEYVRFGMLRFIRGQYASAVRHGGMLAFVLNGDVANAITGVEGNIRTNFSDLGMNASDGFQVSTGRPGDDRLRETRHRRNGQVLPFVIQHLFMAGDPDAPILPEPPPKPPKELQKPLKTRKPANK